MIRFNSTFSILLRRFGLFLAAALTFVLITAAPALAHVDLDSSTPSDGTSVSVAPAVIELRFTSEAVPAGDGIVLAMADGTPVETAVAQPEPTVVLVTPVDPLPNGVYGVLWTMRAGDAHPRSGTFTFQVDASSPIASPNDLSGSEPVTLDPVFDIEISESPFGLSLGAVGRWAAMAGALVGIGAFAFAATSLIGTRREVEEAGYWVRRAGILIVVGTVVELLGASMVLAGSLVGGLSPSSMIEVISGSFGIAMLLRISGGLAMVRGTAIVASKASNPIADASQLPSRGRDDGRVAVLERVKPAYRLDVHHERLALVGIGLVALSYMFDGHTVTASPTVLVRAASATHVVAGGVWVGGVLLMAWTLARRHRSGVDLDAAPMVIRFSRVASVALAAVAVAGTALAIAILDAPSELATTPWGRTLMVKLVAVGAAAAIGAYNHFVTVPALESDPHDSATADRLRRLVRVEGVILLGVVIVTAVLVGAAS